MLKTKEVRIDCKRLSKCGMRSAEWCRRFRHVHEECADCTLLHRFYSGNTKVVDGMVLRRCSGCGRFMPLSRFYKRKCRRGEKVYDTYTSLCVFCISDYNKRRKLAAMVERK